MSKCTERNLNFLKSLNKCNSKTRQNLLAKSSCDNIKVLSEIALNTLKGKLNIKPKHLQKLKKHKEKIRKLAKKNLSFKKKRAALIQEGGFLPLLVTPFLSAIGAIAGKAIANSVGI